ncbi:unnamed protein product, partial [Rotaria sp. Silwood1]
MRQHANLIIAEQLQAELIRTKYIKYKLIDEQLQ